MHLAGRLRGIVDAVLLVDVQRVHIGAQRDGAAAGLGTPERADDAGAGQAAMHVEAELLEPFGDEIRRAFFLERGLGMGVNLVPPGGEILVEIGNAIDDGHR
jgi:hypothetical protein